ncbi:uncharacterized protein FIESC28_09676 [Fusarium coffeatum]|uniref:Transcription factor domain-containing protein n=1 Tax=Fusarium coffeatum TaxID=231269 RepID=A0A366R108_9HYPO|nr:uncharacterized protein FIESC28_09676 [Fusarium coffeatum]RBR09930.1 hypothetical protein FIESC28_09676 [Fusarium coffeatum]
MDQCCSYDMPSYTEVPESIGTFESADTHRKDSTEFDSSGPPKPEVERQRDVASKKRKAEDDNRSSVDLSKATNFNAQSHSLAETTHGPKFLGQSGRHVAVLSPVPQGIQYQTPPQCDISTEKENGIQQVLAGMIQDLPSMEKPKIEANKFNCLLDDDEQKDLEEIRGGSGVSIKLIHLISQITYCAAYWKRRPDSLVLPVTGRYLVKALSNIQIWQNRARNQRADSAANPNPAIENPASELWRIAAAVYLQCRLFRLARLHVHVVANVKYLSECIDIMLKLGPDSPVQVPSLPAFMLGMLASTSEQKEISNHWLKYNVEAKDRRAIKKIWARIADEVEIKDEKVTVGESWWETQVVRKVPMDKWQEMCRI